MAPWPLVVVAGAAIGMLLGLFGVGGSSVATPVLSLLGVSALAAVASPLPAIIPAAALAAAPYVSAGEARRGAATWSLVGGVPATIAGALLSRVVGGTALLLVSGIVLMVVGLRVVRPIGQAARDVGTQRRRNRPLLVLVSAAIGLFTGLLANGAASSWCPSISSSSASGCARPS